MGDDRLEQFIVNLHQEVLQKTGQTAEEEGDDRLLLREEAFAEAVLELLTDHNEAMGWEVCSVEFPKAGPQPAGKLNAWALSGDGANLDLYVVLYNGTGQLVESSKSEVQRYFRLAYGFLKRALDGVHTGMEEAAAAFHAAQQIWDAHANRRLSSVRIVLLTDTVAKSLDIEPEPHPSLEIKLAAWDMKQLSRLRAGQHQPIEIDFVNKYGGAINCIEGGDPGGEYRTFLAFFPGTLLARIYNDHGQRLLERNVRAFLQAKGKVNKGLQKTLSDESHRFLAYNNGLCCTAAEVALLDANGAVRLARVRDFQIVNGGQTTASIAYAQRTGVPLNQVTVQVKLTVLSNPALTDEVVPLISRYANSQNKVNGADFSANSPFHRQLEALSRVTWAPAKSGLERATHWYYERARGSWFDTKAKQGVPAKRKEWEKENPLWQKFTKTDLAKYEHAWMGLPHLVCLGAEKNFVRYAEDLARDGEPPVDENYFRHVVAKAILFRAGEEAFNALKLTGYRANSVAYAVAWLAMCSEQRIDLEEIWRKQGIGLTLRQALSEVCGWAHQHIIGQAGNPGEASKKEHCWKAFLHTEVQISSDWKSHLASVPFASRRSSDDALHEEWERMRLEFIADDRNLHEIEQEAGFTWIASRRNDPVAKYAQMTWEELLAAKGLGVKKVRDLVKVLAAAARK